MLKKLMMTGSVVLALGTSLPAAATSAWDYAGRITDRTPTSITVFVRNDHVTVRFDEQTTIAPWIREKPFVRKPVVLTPAALKFGGLVRVHRREGLDVADWIEVANDVKRVFRGRVVRSDATSVAVYQKDMGVVALNIIDGTQFGELLLARPFVKKPVRVTPSDIATGSLIEMYASKTDPLAASLVELALSEPVSASPVVNPVRVIR